VHSGQKQGELNVFWLLAFLRRLRDDAAGNTLAICAAAILPLAAVIGSGLDLADAYMTRARLQNACDAASLAGRQYMQGTVFNQDVKDEAQKFFNFNFPAGTSNVSNLTFTIAQDKDEDNQLDGVASALVPTTLMKIFGYRNIPIQVDCNATRDMGHNDIALVLDVTGSMADPPSSGGASKISRLREGAMGLYKALESDDGSITRFAIIPYSHTVNVARSLENKDILSDQPYVQYPTTTCTGNGKKQKCTTSYTVSLKTVNINESSWNIGKGGGDSGGNTENFRTSGDGCIEERPSVGEAFSLTQPFKIDDTITQADVDTRAGNAGNQPELQFGRYDPPSHTNSGTTTSGGVKFYDIGNNWVQTGCPAEATRLQTYDSEDDFQAAIDAATARVTGGTYHDIGMLWGLRFISRTGFFASDNPTERDGIPVNEHIVFMTDGKLDTGDLLYSAYGIQRYEQRVQGCSWGNSGCNAVHIARFKAACNLAKSMGITVWVIALDVTDTSDIKDCATSADHFYTSDGSDLEEIFEKIGQGIGNLRLTR
jgi:Flp pilus assembly protein TadG